MFTTEYEHSCMLDAHPLIYFPKIWDDFSMMIRSTSNKNIFNKDTKDHFLENFLITLYAIDCYVLIVTCTGFATLFICRWGACAVSLSFLPWGVSPSLVPLSGLPSYPTSTIQLGCLGSCYRNPSDYAILCVHSSAHLCGTCFVLVPHAKCTNSQELEQKQLC
jgi:hypothetical protein